MQNKLLVAITLDGKLLEQCSFDKQSIVIGRHSECDLVLDNPGVSRTHVEITREDGDVFASDLGSSNGTLLNGARIERAQLRDGDCLRIGKFDLHIGLPRIDTGKRDVAGLYERDQTIRSDPDHRSPRR